MAQQPAKLRWKEDCWYGLSASQFGMALGFTGRVTDFVDYLRNIVGTEQEFRGNAFTDHGIVTEPKARALYEMLTGTQVHDGGFFLAHGRLLGCSPDGQIFYNGDTRAHSNLGQGGTYSRTVTDTSTGTASPASPLTNHNAPWFAPRSPRTPDDGPVGRIPTPLSLSLSSNAHMPSSGPPSVTTQCAIRIPFSKKRSRSSAQGAPAAGVAEVKGMRPSSVSRTPSDQRLGDASGDGVLVRTRRRRLLEIKSPFRALYDCKKKEYQPFGIPPHYMCQMQGQMAIADAEECDFFVYLDHPCQVEAWRVKRSRAFWRWAEPKLLSVVAWTRDGPPEWLDRSFVFEPFDFTTLEVEPLVFPFDISLGVALWDAQRFRFFQQYDSPHTDLPTAQAESALGGSLAQPHVLRACPPAARLTAKNVCCDAVRFLFCDASMAAPLSLESLADAVVAREERSAQAQAAAGAQPGIDTPRAKEDAVATRLFAIAEHGSRYLRQLTQAATWNALQPDSVAGGAHEQDAAPTRFLRLQSPLDWEPAEIPVFVDDVTHRVRCYHHAFFTTLTALKSGTGELRDDDAVRLASSPRTPLGDDSVMPNRGDLRDDFLHRTPVRDVVPAGESLSQHIRLSLTPRETSTSGAGECASSSELEPKFIAGEDLVELIRLSDDCSDVWLLTEQNSHVLARVDEAAAVVQGHAPPFTVRHHVRAVDVDKDETGEEEVAAFSLLVGRAKNVHRLVDDALSARAPPCSVPSTLMQAIRGACIATGARDADGTMLASSTAPRTQLPPRLVLCYVESCVDACARATIGVYPPLPCFVVQADDAKYVLARCAESLSKWE